MIETMLFLFLGIWLPCFVYFALFVYLFREGVAEGLDSSGNNFKQTVQWLTVVVFLLFSNYLVMMFARYPEFGTSEFEELCKFSLSKVFLLSSFISSLKLNRNHRPTAKTNTEIIKLIMKNNFGCFFSNSSKYGFILKAISSPP